MAEDGWLQAETDGSIMLRVRVIPRSRQAGFGPVRAGRLVARITRPPVDGKANQELLKTLASALGCKRAELSIVQGGDNPRQDRARSDAPCGFANHRGCIGPLPGVVIRQCVRVSVGRW